MKNASASKKRKTQQRDAIRQTLVEAGRPLSPQEIQSAAQDQVPTLGIATVYRNIKTMIDDGSIKAVELPGAPSRYEIAGKSHHHHFHCRECDGVFEVEACPGGLKDLAPTGFSLESHEITLYGVCRDCKVD